MQKITKYMLLFVLSGIFTTAQAQWFNDDMGSTPSGSAAPCPWINATGACNPPGVTNNGVCTAGSLGTPFWLTGSTASASTSYCWTATSAGNTTCSFTYTLTVTGTATISTVTFASRRSTSGAPNMTFTINGVSKTPSPATLTSTSSFETITVAVSPAITVTNGTFTIVLGLSGASNSSVNWTNRIDDFKLFGTTFPIELTDFTAKPTPAGPRLNWTTATERNNDYFSIERSATGEKYTEIAQVKGAGDAQSAQFYDFTDTKPLKGVNYYRLKQVDYDGNSSYSPVQSVKMGTGTTVIFAPNPLQAGATTTLQYESATETELDISIFNTLGQLSGQMHLQAEKGPNNLLLDTSQLPKGIYAIQIRNDAGLSDTQQLVVK